MFRYLWNLFKKKNKSSLAKKDNKLFHINDKNIKSFLIEKDFSLKMVNNILENLNKINKKEDVAKSSKDKLFYILKEKILSYNMNFNLYQQLKPHKKRILLIFGVNGAGKTTSIGKLIFYFKNKFNKILLVPCDQFRAAAVNQLKYWADIQFQDFFLSKGTQNSAAILHDALSYSEPRNHDLIICDTSGRLHNNKNLMMELQKLQKVIQKKTPDAHVQNLFVLDAHTGKNALKQIQSFHEHLGIHGIILTKMDSSSKAGILFDIFEKYKIPVYFIGVGEKMEDLKEFTADSYLKEFFA